METKANFVLIGTATVLGILGLLGLLIWFSKVQIDRQYAWYETLFVDVSGLGMAADVRYNGLSVGQVIDIELDQDDPSKVRVRVEVTADTPIKTDTVAQLNSQGVTGVAFVALSGGSPEAPMLRNPFDTTVIPVIPSERSVVQALTQDAPDLMEEALAVIKDLRTLLGPENRSSVTNLLQNLEAASGELETALSDFSDISRTVADGTAQISKFTGRLDQIGETFQTTLDKVGETLDIAQIGLAEVAPTMKSAAAAFDTAETTISNVDEIVETRVPQIADALSTTIQTIETAATDLSRQFATVLTQFGGTAEAATARLVALEATMATLDKTLEEASTAMIAVESASVSFEDLTDGEGTELVADARQALASMQGTVARMDQLLQESVPPIFADIRTAVTRAVDVIDQVSNDVTAFTTRLDPLVDTGDTALKAATETLHNANRTLANLDQALGTTEKTMTAAERTFASAEMAIDTDLAPAISDIRTAAGQFEATMATLSQDIPAITSDLRNAMARALDVIEQIDAAVAASVPPIQTFARTGLPEFTKFARESQQLVYQLEQLTKKLARDPARFFFGNNVPEFRR